MMVSLPTRRADWRLMGRTARLVVTIPAYAAIAAVAAVAGLTAFSLSLNVSLVVDTLSLPISTVSKVELLASLYPFVGTAFTPLQGGLLVVVAATLGVNVAMVAYHFREHGLSLQQGGTSVLGAVLGALGAGCAACGSAILLGLLSLVGVSTSLLWLPLDGLEFAVLALAVVVLSTYWLADGMRGGQINGCPIDI
ncbi:MULTISPECIES: hypothetical protein [Halomicrobium]|uniref:Uncharacterized protein n=2 Tax=Halomicrobium mukohataei TaxID=57705 RepID=C7P163_HALMD|nr:MULTISPECIES: hypothetical protein [Halomicrobium]ACV49078.1 conserved hypothetical protein [Halomicrobium mukohataei DSM 12286]QCD64494.1 hypothetical protein E5139_02140 [Halomicrobium mukohataei]QFR19300.1 hypothetical protein GBQ70_02140 [Halomicrobium sp. ZPS1]